MKFPEAPARIAAAEYYKGAPFGDEEDGRSQIVLSEVRDTIQSVLPSLMRIFTSGERIVDYMPRTAQAIPIAERTSQGEDVQELGGGGLVQVGAAKGWGVQDGGAIVGQAEPSADLAFGGISAR